MTYEERLVEAAAEAVAEAVIKAFVFQVVCDVIIEQATDRAIRALGYSKTGDICRDSGIYESLCVDPGYATISAGEKFPPRSNRRYAVIWRPWILTKELRLLELLM